MYSLQIELRNDGDTLTSNDLVMKQYRSLPYPKISEEYILKEEGYYRLDKNTPKHTAPSQTLEKINHYLNRGNEDFR